MAQRARLGYKKEVEPGKWRVRVTVGKKRDGNRRTINETVYGTERDADSAIRRIALEMGKNVNFGDGMLVEDYFYNIFMPRKRATKTKVSCATAISIYRCHISPTFGQMDISSIPKLAINKWVSELPPRSAPTMTKVLRSILRAAWKDGLISDEPMRHYIELPRCDRKPLPVWSAEEVKEAIKRVRGIHLEPIILVMVGAGLSVSEARALEWQDFNTDCSQVTVSKAYTAMDGLKEPKTDRRYRTVPILPMCAKRLKEIKGSGLIVTCRNGKRQSNEAQQKEWRSLFWGDRCYIHRRDEIKAGVLCGMNYIGMNRLRATHATLLQAAGINDALNSAIHGHSKLVEYSNYLNPNIEAETQAAKVANSLLEDEPRLRFV